MPPGGAVGVVFDANGNAEGALGPYEEEVRAAGDKAVPWQVMAEGEGDMVSFEASKIGAISYDSSWDDIKSENLLVSFAMENPNAYNEKFI